MVYRPLRNKKPHPAGIIFLILLSITMLMAIQRVASAPIVFKDVNGETCGCIVNEDVPTIKQCELVNSEEYHDVIEVSHCK